jgi:hypothetical protein
VSSVIEFSLGWGTPHQRLSRGSKGTGFQFIVGEPRHKSEIPLQFFEFKPGLEPRSPDVTQAKSWPRIRPGQRFAPFGTDFGLTGELRGLMTRAHDQRFDHRHRSPPHPRGMGGRSRLTIVALPPDPSRGFPPSK